jgi:hypothetical protein
MSDQRSALDALSAIEKGAVLDDLLTARPDLREPAEAHAARLMKDAERSAIADDVASALKWLDVSELNTRAGYQPGFGYVNPAEAADEILDEALQPFLDDLQRRAGLGMASAAAEVAAGGSCWGCTTAGTAALKPCWNTPRTTRQSARQWWSITAPSWASSYPPSSSTSFRRGATCCIDPCLPCAHAGPSLDEEVRQHGPRSRPSLGRGLG